MDIQLKLQQEFSLKQTQVENVIKLIDEGNTIPFIARYRKEMTGSLDDQLLRTLSERLAYLRNLEDKRTQVKNTITEQGNMTEELEQKLSLAETMTEIEDIYRPFRPKRRTLLVLDLAQVPRWEIDAGKIQIICNDIFPCFRNTMPTCMTAD